MCIGRVQVVWPDKHKKLLFVILEGRPASPGIMTSSHALPRLLALSDEVLLAIISHLPRARDIAALQACCSRLASVTQDDNVSLKSATTRSATLFADTSCITSAALETAFYSAFPRRGSPSPRLIPFALCSVRQGKRQATRDTALWQPYQRKPS